MFFFRNRKQDLFVIIKLILSLVFLVGFIFLAYQSVLVFRVNAFSAEVRPSLKKVLNSFYISQVSGEYWENEMLEQFKAISQLSPDKRIEYYKGILFYCDLDTSKAYLFYEMVGSDSQYLFEKLKEIQNSTDYRDMSRKRRKLIDYSIEDLEVINKSGIF